MNQPAMSLVTITVAPGLGWPSPGTQVVRGLGWPQVKQQVDPVVGHTDSIPTEATQEVV
jgi:hypothetical protein